MEGNYEDKKRMLFESLETAEKGLQGTSLEQSSRDYNYGLYRNQQQRKRTREESIAKYKHKDSMFKRPELPINKVLRSRQRPGYEQNPNKYTHYSLDDVSDTSERMNSSAAFNFLRELEERKAKESQMDCDEASGSQKIVFKKSIRLKPKDDEPDPQLNVKKIQSSKVVMPEYVIGEKKPKTKRKVDRTKDQSRAVGNSLKLSHLDEDEEDD